MLADLTTVIPVRYSSGASAEAFAVTSGGDRRPVQVKAEDLASVLLRFENGARGCFSVGQVLPGHKNDLELEVNGRALSLKWKQEQQNELWIGRHDQSNLMMAKDPSLVSPGRASVCAPAWRAPGVMGGCVLQSAARCLSMDTGGWASGSKARDVTDL